MSFLIFIVSIAAMVVALKALRDSQPRPGQPTPAERIASLEERVRDLLFRVWTLEKQAGEKQASERQVPERPVADQQAGGVQAAQDMAAPPEPYVLPVPKPPVPAMSLPPVPETEPALAPAWSATEAGVREAEVGAAAPTPAPEPVPARAPAARLNLEQRIGARWTTWVGVVAILFAASFAVKLSIENDLIGPRARLGLGLATGAVLLAAGLGLHRRRDVPYLSEGLSGLGLGLCYLSLFAGYAYYDLLQVGAAFALMFIVTVVGTGVAVVTERQVTAVLALLGEHRSAVHQGPAEPDDADSWALVVLDLLVLAIARFRIWRGLSRIAWAGTVLLLAPMLTRQPESDYPVARLVLLSRCSSPALPPHAPRPRVEPGRARGLEVDLHRGGHRRRGYFWAVYVTLEAWRPILEAPAALALAILYTVLAGLYRRRVADDEATVAVLMGLACVFLTLAIPLALKGPWITLAWAVEGAVLISIAPRLTAPVAPWGGTAAVFLAAFHVVALDKWGSAYWTPVWNATFLAHLLTVADIVLAGQLALRLRPGQMQRVSREGLGSTLWVLASLTLSVLLWREPSGLWPAGLLTAQLLALGFLSRLVASPAFTVAVPLAGITVLARTLFAYGTMARAAPRCWAMSTWSCGCSRASPSPSRALPCRLGRLAPCRPGRAHGVGHGGGWFSSSC
jgi:uncharacterized membrane protein